jgi:hypothetical protein
LIRLTAAALAAGVIALSAGCSAAGQATTPAAAHHAATTPTAPLAATPAPSPARRLTIAQARTAYVRISRPFNAAVAAVNHDVGDAAPWDRFRADTLAVIRADRAWARNVRAIQWPPRVQRYISATVQTDVPAEIRCDRAMATAGSWPAATSVFNTRQDCKDNTANEDKIRAILHLPPLD